MPVHELVLIKSRKALHAAAVGRERVRVRGVVVERGDGYSGPYRNVWLRVAVAGVSVRVTAGQESPLGTLPVGSRVELTCRLTGLVDVAEGVFYAERTKLSRLLSNSRGFGA